MPLLGAGSVLSHLSAAVLHELPLPGTGLDRVWVTRDGGGHGRRGSVVHLRRCRLEDDEIVEMDGLPVTSLARTAIDLARLLEIEWGVISCDAAMAAGVSRDLLRLSAARAQGRPGARRAEKAADFADGRAESPLESVSRLQIQRLGYPPPVLQYPVVNVGEVLATVDFCWEDARLVGECDGAAKYDTLLRPGEVPADAIMREKRREERIRGASYWLCRWGWREAWDRERLRGVLDRAFAIAPKASRHGERRPNVATRPTM